METAFFWRWWQRQNEEKKQLAKKLVENGQLVFTGGGWSMNDEAAAHYSSIIDNMAFGFLELKEHFGIFSVNGSGILVNMMLL